QPRSVSTRRRAIAVCDNSRFEASTRSRPLPRGSPSPRTWRAVSLSNPNLGDRFFLTSPSILGPIFSQALSVSQARPKTGGGGRYQGEDFARLSSRGRSLVDSRAGRGRPFSGQ